MSKRQGHYRLHAYVCGAGCVREADVDGTLTFHQVFMKRPSECRYAVVSEWDVDEHRDRVLVWDMYEVRKGLRARSFAPPSTTKKFDDVDQAIMSTLMLYEDE